MKAVLWDFDGTIADTEPIWLAVERRFVEDLGGVFESWVADVVTGASMTKTAEVLASLLPEHSLDLDEINDELNAGVIETVASNPLPYKPGVKELLAELTELGIPCALVSTSTRKLLELAVSRMEAVPFAVIVGGEDVTDAKPHPEGYLKAMVQLGVVADDVLIIEDSALGSQAGNAAGAVVLTVPDQVKVPAAPRRVRRESLAGLTVADLRTIWEDAQ